MLYSAIPLWLFLLTVSADSFNSSLSNIHTEKPDKLYEDSPVPKPRKPPSHISDFTDPDTGYNPFLDVPEGPTYAGRDVMKDERREDPPFLDYELVEGDSSDRRLDFDVPKEPSEEPAVHRRPFFEDRRMYKDLSSTTIQYVTETPSTTMDSHVTTSEEILFDVQISDEHKIKKAVTSSSISKDSIIYAASTVVVVVALALLFGVCWWRRKLKRTSQSPISAENGELKS
ncbi:uncharacterized protein NPIL_229001 [Nephila pilipes]|uniref:Uncharacterized protein n=1 Tax=Nephila pilipes TaxID=299642 RepID=A0A8X6P2J3_NEPPI|nr:uncharacterized protein NPIL_229001 [Nephila pilipes]